MPLGATLNDGGSAPGTAVHWLIGSLAFVDWSSVPDGSLRTMFPPERVMVSVADCGATVCKLRPLARVPANVGHFRQVA